MTMVSLREWETRRPEPGSILAQQSLAAYPAGRRLAEELTKTGRMEVLELTRGLELRATSFVGRFLLGELTVTVHPENLSRAAAEPFSLCLRFTTPRSLRGYGFRDVGWSFQDLLIQQLAAEASELLERGIHRDYERIRVDLANPRGRIDFTRYLRTARARPGDAAMRTPPAQ